MVCQLKPSFNETSAVLVGIIKIFNKIEVRISILIKIAILPLTQRNGEKNTGKWVFSGQMLIVSIPTLILGSSVFIFIGKLLVRISFSFS